MSPPVPRIEIQGGRKRIGTTDPIIAGDGEAPPRTTTIRSFAIEPVAVTNARFATFAKATGYVTDSERFGWSFVFSGLLAEDFPPTAAAAAVPWWRRVEGACWSAPLGPGSTVNDKPDHPVTHISWNDAASFARWAGGRLPSEAEWETAARGGLEDATYPWGNAEPDDETFMPCNIWQGSFPTHNSAADGHLATAPVQSFEPNGLGLYNMSGNVWEWCAERFRVKGMSRAAKRRDAEARAESERVIKGGSFLCHKSYCHRYRIAARTGRSPDSAAVHTGFRLAYDL